jgi:ribosome-associated protein
MINREKLLKIVTEHTHFTFSRSSGRGGQNVNKLNTKVLGVLPLNSLTMFSPPELERLKAKLQKRINKKNELFISVQEERTQAQNIKIAVRRLVQLISTALHTPRKRKKTRMPSGAHTERLKAKRKQTEKKRLRRYTPEPE